MCPFRLELLAAERSYSYVAVIHALGGLRNGNWVGLAHRSLFVWILDVAFWTLSKG